MNDQELLEKYKKVVIELKKGESLRRAARLGECSLGTAQRVQKLLNWVGFGNCLKKRQLEGIRLAKLKGNVYKGRKEGSKESVLDFFGKEKNKKERL